MRRTCPASAGNEAVRRFTAYLVKAPDTPTRSLQAGPLSSTFAVDRQSPWLHSGAAAAVKPWTRRRMLIVSGEAPTA